MQRGALLLSFNWIEYLQSEQCNRPNYYEENIYNFCDFVTKSISCSKPVVFFNYLKFLICVLQLDSSDRGLVLAALFSMAIATTYFALLYVIAKYL